MSKNGVYAVLGLCLMIGIVAAAIWMFGYGVIIVAFMALLICLAVVLAYKFGASYD